MLQSKTIRACILLFKITLALHRCRLTVVGKSFQSSGLLHMQGRTQAWTIDTLRTQNTFEIHSHFTVVDNVNVGRGNQAENLNYSNKLFHYIHYI